jgi:plasmid replication initiation protein
MLKRVKNDDMKFEEVKYTENEILCITGLQRKNLYHLKKSLRKFFDNKLVLGDLPTFKKGLEEEEDHFSYTEWRWLDYNGFDKEKGIFILKFAQAMAPYLLELKSKFTLIEIESMVKMTPRSRRIYMFAKQYSTIGHRKMSIDELRDCMELGESYKDFKLLNAKVLKPAQKQINEISDITLSILPDKKNLGHNGKYLNIIFETKLKSGKKYLTQKDDVNMPLNHETLESGEYIGGKDRRTLWASIV